MADEISFEEFRVDLAAMAGVISRVKGEASDIEGAMAEIKRQFAAVETAWRSPAAFTFADISGWFDNCQTELAGVLDDMTSRLDNAYNTYHDMETASLNNLDYADNPPDENQNPPDQSQNQPENKLEARQAAVAPTDPAPADPAPTDTALALTAAREPSAATAPTAALSMVTAREPSGGTNV